MSIRDSSWLYDPFSFDASTPQTVTYSGDGIIHIWEVSELGQYDNLTGINFADAETVALGELDLIAWKGEEEDSNPFVHETPAE